MKQSKLEKEKTKFRPTFTSFVQSISKEPFLACLAVKTSRSIQTVVAFSSHVVAFANGIGIDIAIAVAFLALPSRNKRISEISISTFIALPPSVAFLWEKMNSRLKELDSFNLNQSYFTIHIYLTNHS